MTGDLRTAALLAVAFHGVLLFPGWAVRPASVDVERGPVSFEVELFSEAQMTPSEAAEHVSAPTAAPEEAPWLPDQLKPPVAQRPSLDAQAGHGALMHVQPHGAGNRPPAYPWLARIRGWEGTVVLRVRVEADGHPSAVRIVDSSGYAALDTAAQGAIQEWSFAPARQGGRAVRSEVELPIRFQLTSSKDDGP